MSVETQEKKGKVEWLAGDFVKQVREDLPIRLKDEFPDIEFDVKAGIETDGLHLAVDVEYRREDWFAGNYQVKLAVFSGMFRAKAYDWLWRAVSANVCSEYCQAVLSNPEYALPA